MKHIILSAICATLLCGIGCSRNDRINWLTEDAQQSEMVLYLPEFRPPDLNKGIFVSPKMEADFCKPLKNRGGEFLVFPPVPHQGFDERDYHNLYETDSSNDGKPQFSQSWKVKSSKDGKTLDVMGYRYRDWGITELYELSGTQTAPNCWAGTCLYSFGINGTFSDDFSRLIKFNWHLEPKTDKPKEFDEKFRTIKLTRELPKTTGQEEDDEK